MKRLILIILLSSVGISYSQSVTNPKNIQLPSLKQTSNKGYTVSDPKGVSSTAGEIKVSPRASQTRYQSSTGSYTKQQQQKK